LDWTPYHAHNGVLELLLDVGFVGTGLFLFVLAFGLWRACKFVRGQHDITRLWPLIAMIYFIAGNITEANIAKYNEMNWVIFVVAFLFVSQAPAVKAPSIRINERLDTRPQRRAAALR
jgi:O-antigen ligase